MEIDFEGRAVVITGGTGQLGRAVAELLLQTGARCFLPCRSALKQHDFPPLQQTSVEYEAGIDLTDEDATNEYFSKVPDLWASIHCVGGFAMKPFETIRLQDFDEQLRVNLRTCFLSCKAAVHQIRRSKHGAGGRIVNIASRPALEPRSGAGMVSYTCSKAAVAALSQALGEELAAERIWVTAVAPSTLDTEPNRAAMPGADFSLWPKVEEVARTISFLASPQNQVIRSGVIPAYGQS